MIIKYHKSEHGGIWWDINQGLKDGKWPEPSKGLKLVDRKNPKHVAEIEDVQEIDGFVLIYWVGGGFNCLDHAIEQFKP